MGLDLGHRVRSIVAGVQAVWVPTHLTSLGAGFLENRKKRGTRQKGKKAI